MIYVQVHVLCKFCSESILFFFTMFSISDEKNLLYAYTCMLNSRYFSFSGEMKILQVFEK